MESVSRTQNEWPEEPRTVGDAISGCLKTTWSVREARLPLLALPATLIGAFLPWVAGASATQVVGWHLPVIAVLVATGALIAHVTAPGRPGWLGIVAAGVSFVVAASAAVMLVLLLALAHVITSVEDAVAHLGTFAGAIVGSGHVGVGIGAWMTAASSAVVFTGTLRVLLTSESPHVSY
jgi:hypothetical protein